MPSKWNNVHQSLYQMCINLCESKRQKSRLDARHSGDRTGDTLRRVVCLLLCSQREIAMAGRGFSYRLLALPFSRAISTSFMWWLWVRPELRYQGQASGPFFLQKVGLNWSEEKSSLVVAANHCEWALDCSYDGPMQLNWL